MKAERISVEELKAKMARGEHLQILDVRNRMDYMRSTRALPGAIRIPAAKIEDRLAGLDPGVETIAYCT